MRFKKILIVLLALTMVLGILASCSKKDEKPAETTPAEQQTGKPGGSDTPPTPAEETPNVPRPATPEIPAVANPDSKNETQTFIVQESTFDGIYNPFFYSSAYDMDVVSFVNVTLTMMERDGSIVAGNQYDTFGESYEIFYTDNLDTLAKKDTYEEGDYVVYEVVLKNGAFFSDGTLMTADDVLFNWYVFLDPAYTGSSTFYTLPILGLNDYRTQVPNYAAQQKKFAPAAQAALAMGPDGYKASDAVTEEQYNFYWDAINKQLVKFAQSIYDYVFANYASTEYVQDYLYPTWTIDEVKADAGKSMALAMRMWGFGSFKATGFLPDTTYYVVDQTLYDEVTTAFDEKTTYYTYDAETETYTAAEDLTEFAAGTTYYTQRITYKANTEEFNAKTKYYQLIEDKYVRANNSMLESAFFGGGSGDKYENVSALTINDYVNELLAAYIVGDDYAAEYAELDDTEQASVTLLAPVEQAFVAYCSGSAKVDSIDGLRKGYKKVDGEWHETFIMILTEQNPKAVLDLTITVAPKAYYTAGYTYNANAVVSYGVELNSEAFMAHLHSLDGAPMGAGSYKFVKADGDGVTLVRNDYHFTLGDDTVTNANIKNAYLKVVTGGSEFDALKAGDVHYATVSATADVVADIAKEDNLTSILVDNNGYGYICINPAAVDYNLDNLYVRIALTSVFDLEKVKDYYPEGLADIIYRSQTQVSWAYPEGAEAMYPYDESLNVATMCLALAGYNYDSTAGQFTDVPAFDFYLPSEAKDHPAGGIFLKAQELLAKIGVTVNIHVDESLIANIKKSAVPVYALAWGSSADPDMYQVYHYQSAAESVISNGIQYLQANGTDINEGMIEVTKLDGTKVDMSQAEALTYLAELIEEGLKYMSKEERAPIYTKALEVLAQLNIELPTYQRKNLFAYNSAVIDAASLSSGITPYWGPLAQIWKLSFKA